MSPFNCQPRFNRLAPTSGLVSKSVRQYTEGSMLVRKLSPNLIFYKQILGLHKLFFYEFLSLGQISVRNQTQSIIPPLPSMAHFLYIFEQWKQFWLAEWLVRFVLVYLLLFLSLLSSSPNAPAQFRKLVQLLVQGIWVSYRV